MVVPTLPGERWLPVPGYESLYLVSDHGRVYSVPRIVEYGSRSVSRTGRMLKQGKGSRKDNHPLVGLCRGAQGRTIRVHTLVLTAFVGPCPEGMEACHGDDDPNNNHLSNLRWDTHQQNMCDKVRNGKHWQANKTTCNNGHDFTPENTYIRREGTRCCITCARARTRQWRKQRREQTTRRVA